MVNVLSLGVNFGLFLLNLGCVQFILFVRIKMMFGCFGDDFVVVVYLVVD